MLKFKKTIIILPMRNLCSHFLKTNLVLSYQVQTRYLNPDNLSLDAEGYFTLFLFLYIRFRHDTWTRTICPWTRRDTLPYSCSCISGSDTILEPGQSVPGRGWILHQPRGVAAGPLCLPSLRWWNMTYLSWLAQPRTCTEWIVSNKQIGCRTSSFKIQ